MDHINSCDLARFVELLGNVFEGSAWVAERAYLVQPFRSHQDLHQIMVKTMQQAPDADKLKLLRQYPELKGKEVGDNTLIRTLRAEQVGNRLDACNDEDLKRLKHLNQAYYTRFKFPFILVTSDLDKNQIMAEIESRLEQNPATEFAVALGKIETIALTRIEKLINE